MRKFRKFAIMKHLFKATLLLAFLFTVSSSFAQSGLKKANKEYELNAFKLAIKSYLKVLDKDPTNLIALSRMADSYRLLNMPAEAVNFYEKAINQKGIDPIHILGYAKALQSLGRYEEAKKWFLMYGEGQPIFGNHYAENCDFAVAMRGIKPLYKVKREYVNTASSDFGAAFLDNQVVFSTSRNDLGDRQVNGDRSDWAGQVNNQLVISAFDKNGYLGKPRYFHSDLANNFNEGPLSFSNRGTKVAFTKNNFVEGTRQIPAAGMEMSIFFADVTPLGNWEHSKPFSFNGSGYSSGYPALSEDGKTLFFSSNRPDGYGGYDLYVSYKTGENWTTPMNLGPTVNSPGNELASFYDGNTVFFASDWHQGLGGLDIFRVEKEGDDWTKVYHLGNAINSSYDDYGFVYNAEKNIGYFTSNRPGGKGREDIYQFSKITNQFEIVVLNAEDQTPLPNASVDLTACGESIYATNQNGKYILQTMGTLKCDVIVSKEGFTTKAIQLNTSGEGQTNSISIVLEKPVDKYVGRVYNPVDNSAVNEVSVIVTDQSTGQQTRTQTKKDGTYELALVPGTNYLIRFSKAGFLETNNRIAFNDPEDKGILGTIAFRPVGTDRPTTTTVETNTGSSTSDDTSTASTSTDPPVVEMNATDPDTDVITEGFAVQLAAMPLTGVVKKSVYEGLTTAGNVYSRPDGNFKKVRVGIFASRDEARKAQGIARTEGFPSAFIVKENLDDMVEVDFIYEPQEPATPPVAKTETPSAPTKEVIDISEPPVDDTTTQPAKGNSPYKVRLASYRNIAFFQEDKVNQIGEVEKMKSGDFTVVLLNGFADLDAAISAQKSAVDSGFRGAHIVIEEDGRLIKVNM